MKLTDTAPDTAPVATVAPGVLISGAVPAAVAVRTAAVRAAAVRSAVVRTAVDCTRRPLHAPAAQTMRAADPDDVFADDNDDFVWIDLERMLAGREAARRLHPSFKG